MDNPQKGRIFISYRRTDSAGYAGRIYDRLTAHFGKDAVFMDVDTIEAGVDFVEVLQNAVQSCDVLVALIGQRWVNIKDETGKSRLDNPEDFVRVEVAAALDREIRVIPVLVDGVPMPRSTELPENLRLLSRRNAVQVNHHSFNADTHRLISQLELALKVAEDSKILKAKAVQEAQERAQRQAEIEKLLKAADLAIDLKDWKLAHEKLNNVLKLDSGYLDAQTKLDIVRRKISEIEQEKEAREKASADQRDRFAFEKKNDQERQERDREIAAERVRTVPDKPASKSLEKAYWRPYGISGTIILALACLFFGGRVFYRMVFPETVNTQFVTDEPKPTEVISTKTPSDGPDPTMTASQLSTTISSSETPLVQEGTLSSEHQNYLLFEEFDSAEGFTSTDTDIFIQNGKVYWTVYRDGGEQYIYRKISEISVPFKMTVVGQVNSATNNCQVQVGIGEELGTGPEITFGWFGGGCPVQGYKIGSSVPLNLSPHECVPGESSDWLWINGNTEYAATLTIDYQNVLLDVPGVGSVDGPSYNLGAYDMLYVGLSGGGDWPHCSGEVERITIEPID